MSITRIFSLCVFSFFSINLFSTVSFAKDGYDKDLNLRAKFVMKEISSFKIKDKFPYIWVDFDCMRGKCDWKEIRVTACLGKSVAPFWGDVRSEIFTNEPNFHFAEMKVQRIGNDVYKVIVDLSDTTLNYLLRLDCPRSGWELEGCKIKSFSGHFTGMDYETKKPYELSYELVPYPTDAKNNNCL